MFERVGPGAGGGRDDRSPVGAVPDLAGLEHLRPTELMSVLAGVHPDDVVDGYDLVELAAACRRLKAWADGVEVETVAGVRSARSGRRARPAEPATRVMTVTSAGRCRADRAGHRAQADS